MSRPPYERTGLPEGRDRSIDNPRIHRRHGVIVHPQALHYARAKGLDDDICRGGQLEEQGAAPRILKVQSEALFSPVRIVEVDGTIAPALTNMAIRLPLAQALHLDHLGAVVRQHHRGRGAWKKERQVEHPNAVKFHARDP